MKIVYDIDSDHPSINYSGPDSEKYKTISKWHKRHITVSCNDFCAAKSTHETEILRCKFIDYNRSIDLGTLRETDNGILYSPQRNAYLYWDFEDDKTFMYLYNILPQLQLLDVDVKLFSSIHHTHHLHLK